MDRERSQLPFPLTFAGNIIKEVAREVLVQTAKAQEAKDPLSKKAKKWGLLRSALIRRK